MAQHILGGDRDMGADQPGVSGPTVSYGAEVDLAHVGVQHRQAPGAQGRHVAYCPTRIQAQDGADGHHVALDRRGVDDQTGIGVDAPANAHEAAGSNQPLRFVVVDSGERELGHGDHSTRADQSTADHVVHGPSFAPTRSGVEPLGWAVENVTAGRTDVDGAVREVLPTPPNVSE